MLRVSKIACIYFISSLTKVEKYSKMSKYRTCQSIVLQIYHIFCITLCQVFIWTLTMVLQSISCPLHQIWSWILLKTSEWDVMLCHSIVLAVYCMLHEHHFWVRSAYLSLRPSVTHAPSTIRLLKPLVECLDHISPSLQGGCVHSSENNSYLVPSTLV